MAYTIFETFVGAGGTHIGFCKNGFVSKYVNDIEDTCLETLTYNNPEIKKTAYIDSTSILDIDANELLNKTNMNKYELDVFFGGIVCKGFSLAGERSPNDERNYFYHKQLELVEAVQPKISMIENVLGIVNAKVLSKDTPDDVKDEVSALWKSLENFKGLKAKLRKENQITDEIHDRGKELRLKKENILKRLENDGYLISVLDDIYNIYKKMGYRVSHKVLNAEWYGSSTKRERIIIVAVRGDIKKKFKFPKPQYMDKSLMKSLDKTLHQEEFKKPLTINDAFGLIDYSDDKDIDNQPMNHAPKTVERFKYIPEGACITGFPLEYKFFGSHSKRCEHVGNAVPPQLSSALAQSCIELLSDLDYGSLNNIPICVNSVNYDKYIASTYKLSGDRSV